MLSTRRQEGALVPPDEEAASFLLGTLRARKS
jgi:hypothetical protein